MRANRLKLPLQEAVYWGMFNWANSFSALLFAIVVSNSLLAQTTDGISPPKTTSPAAAAAPQSATQSAPTPTISVNARLVNLPVIVRDKKGKPIDGLTKADFALTVDGHPQTIRYFDRDNDLPLTLGLLVDVSGSVRNAIDEERTASEAFLDQMMQEPANRAPDKAFLIQFAHEAELLQDLTPSRPKLREALNELGTPPKDEAQDQTQDRTRTTRIIKTEAATGAAAAMGMEAGAAAAATVRHYMTQSFLPPTS